MNKSQLKLGKRVAERIYSKYGNWALVTGASSGIGLALSKLIASSGLNVIISSRNGNVLNEIKADIERVYRVEVRTVSADLSTTEGVVSVISACEKLSIGLFVSSAGYGTSGYLSDSVIEQEVNMLRVNCEASLLLTHHFAKRFIYQKRGGIILMSSMVAFQGVPYSANYSASKAYIQSLAEALHRELKSHNIDVLAAAPGPVKSGFSSRANMEMDMYLKPEDVAAPILKALGRKTTVLPGLLTKFLVYSLRTVPRWGKVRIMEKVMGGMTQHQRV